MNASVDLHELRLNLSPQCYYVLVEISMKKMTSTLNIILKKIINKLTFIDFRVKTQTLHFISIHMHMSLSRFWHRQRGARINEQIDR